MTRILRLTGLLNKTGRETTVWVGAEVNHGHGLGQQSRLAYDSRHTTAYGLAESSPSLIYLPLGCGRSCWYNPTKPRKESRTTAGRQP